MHSFSHRPISANYILSAAALLIVIIGSILPFWTTTLIPATDLPQHLAQMHLLEHALSDAAPNHVVTPWYYANTLVCWLLYAFWSITDPLTAGRLIMSLLGASWAIASLALCRAYNRPFESWCLVSPLVFNFLFSWGLLNFLVGWPVFCMFLIAAGQPKPFKAQPFVVCLLAALLYFSHALWFAIGFGWLIAYQLSLPKPARKYSNVVATLPVWALAGFWYPELAANRAASGVETSSTWANHPLERIELSTFTDAAMGGSAISIEHLVVTTILCCIASSLIRTPREIETLANRPILVAGLSLLLAYWVLPNVYMNTIFFSERWLPLGLVLCALALPPPKVPRPVVILTGIALFAWTSFATQEQWRSWESQRLEGFFDSMDKIGAEDRVLGIVFYDGEHGAKGRPELQFFAYAQALRGAGIFFEFTEHYSGAVQFKSPTGPNIYRHLVWKPGTVTREQAHQFSSILVSAPPNMHSHIQRHLSLAQVGTETSLWRVYKPKTSP